ncbi:MAG: hypothetical protein NC241_03615 [Bacteroides sp.]|nr:hypothetical protein [Bacteroides sp.]MCM1457920.1 hypothetical protein [Lachnoclostridium sp.]
MDIITKTLYIQIDETPMPLTQPELVKLVKTVDCRLLNDFYSIFGDALCGDLTAHDGRPLYRLITPAGRILAEYAASDGSAEALADLRQQWYDLLVGILDGSAAPTYTFTLPTHFRRWLDRHPSNDLYPIIASQSEVVLNIADYATEIREQADKIINCAGFTDCKRYVFSTPVSSQAWYQEIQKIFYEKFTVPVKPDDISITGCLLGKADWWMFAWLGATENPGGHKPFEYLNYKGAQIWFKDGIWNSTYVTRSDSRSFNLFFSKIFTYQKNTNKSYNSIYRNPGVYLERAPEIDSSNWFKAELSLSLQRRYSYSIKFCFLLHISNKFIWRIPENDRDALYSISISTNL